MKTFFTNIRFNSNNTIDKFSIVSVDQFDNQFEFFTSCDSIEYIVALLNTYKVITLIVEFKNKIYLSNFLYRNLSTENFKSIKIITYEL